MIVTCGQCQTRFKIPDEKVAPEKGVRVRCTKCGHTFRVFRDPSTATTEKHPQLRPMPTSVGPETDPFARFAPVEEVTLPGGAPPREAAPHPPVPSPPGAGAAPVGRRKESRAPAPFDFSAIAPPAPAPPSPSPSAAATPQRFDFSNLAPAPPADGVVTSPGTTAAFDFSSLEPAAPIGGVVPPPAAPRLAEPPPLAVPVQARPLPAPPPAGGAFQPLPSAFPPGADAFFGAPLEADQPKPFLDLPEHLEPEEAKGMLFDLPPPEPLSAPHESPARHLSLDEGAAVISQPIGAVKLEPYRAPAEPPKKRTRLGVVINVVIAAALVAGLVVVGSALLNEGSVSWDTLSLKGLTNLFVSHSQFPASDISNGLYETRSGRSVFFVRGRIANRGGQPTRVEVQADIVEETSVVRSATALVGAVPTPEELYELSLGQGDAVNTLETRLAPRALSLAPGAAGEFLVAFSEFPPDLEGFRVRISARAEPAIDHPIGAR